MGIRFRCHICNQPLNVKDFQAGKRGRCPGCQGAFRIPQSDAEFSIPLEAATSEAVHRETMPSSVATLEHPSSRHSSPAIRPVEHKEVQQPASAQPAIEPPAGNIPKCLLPHLDARWFVRPPSGGQYGPSDTPTLTEWITQRRVTSDSYLWRDGMETWQLAEELLPELFASDTTSPNANAGPPPVSIPVPSPMSELAKEASKGSMATAKANLLQRRKKKQMRTWIVIGLLILIALSLIALLAVVLMR